MTGAAPAAPRQPFDFGRSFTFVGEDPEWIPKLAIGGAFTLACAVLVGIPFVLGYFARTLRNVTRGVTPALPAWRDELGSLFEEGLRLTAVYFVYVVALLAGLGVLGALVLLPALLTAGGGKASDAVGALSALGILGLYALLLVASLALAAYLPAALARTALGGSVSDGFDWRANFELIRANLGNYALALVSYLLASFLSQFGILLCCVGIFPAAFWSYLVLAHGLGQTLRLGPRTG
jgi:hypothetical protein